MQEIIEFIQKTNNKTRVKTLKSRPDVLEWLNNTYPNVPLLMQAQAVIHSKSPFCEICNGPKKEIHATTCSRECGQQQVRQSGKLVAKLEKRHSTMIEKYGAKVSPKALEATRGRASSMNQKAKETLKKKYNVDNASQIPGHREKCVMTLTTNYGVDHWAKTYEAQHALEQLRIDKIIKSLPDTIKFSSLTTNQDKIKLFENPNKEVTFTCIPCDTTETIPTETFKWRLRKTGTCCTSCSGVNATSSLPQQQITSFVNNELGIATKENLPILNGKHIDIYIPTHKFGIEFNGLYWHTDERLGKTYHNEKTKLANDLGITLYHVFEDEWQHTPEIVKSRIRNKLGLSTVKIPARKTTVKSVTTAEEKLFLTENHIQSYSKSSVKLGLYFHDELVSLMTFSKPSIAKGQTKDSVEWELLRFCNKNNHSVIGAASKLFSHFVKNYDPKSILSFADRRYSEGNLYKVLNFEYKGDTRLNYWYVDLSKLKRIHRFSLRKNKEDDQTLTEYENRQIQGWSRIWDCGSSKWVWRKK